MLSSIFVLIVISFATYLAINNTDPQVAFYMPYTRAWELALGGVIAFLPEIANKRFSNFRKLLPWIGIILIGAAVFQFRSPVDFTGNKVVASVLGAFLLIYAIQPTSLLYRILASRPLVFVGKISYSIYLFHLPMIVLWKHYAGTSIIPHGYGLLFIITTIFISWLSWRFIEQPFRQAQWNWRAVFPTFFVSELAIACLCGIVLFTDGAAARVTASAQSIDSLDVMWNWSCPNLYTLAESPRCTGGTPWDNAIGHAVIWGDSNAAHFMPMLDAAAHRQNVSISLLSSCAPMVATGYAMEFADNAPSRMHECDAMHRSVVNALNRQDISMVILAAAWHRKTLRLYKNSSDRLDEDSGLLLLKSALNKLLPEIATEGRTVVIISEVPNWFVDPIPCVLALKTNLLRSSSFRSTCRDKIDNFDRTYYNLYQERTDNVLRTFNNRKGVVIWPTVDDLCSKKSCTTVVDGEFIYRDEGHLRRNLKAQTNVDLADLLQFGKLMELAKQ